MAAAAAPRAMSHQGKGTPGGAAGASAAAAGAPAPFLSDPERDLANWVPTGDGITFYVPVAHAAGDYRPLTLYWFDFRRLRAGIPADVQAVLAS